ncbi:MAG TPA: metalloregulator ArsR/SmtB family transcription factor [Gryllotalpicola sp.]
MSTPVAEVKAELFKALAHPIRVRALEVLVRGECSVGALAEQLDVELSHLSHQLGVLRRARVVSTRRDGSVVYYSLRDPRVSQLLVSAKQIVLSMLEDSAGLIEALAQELPAR